MKQLGLTELEDHLLSIVKRRYTDYAGRDRCLQYIILEEFFSKSVRRMAAKNKWFSKVSIRESECLVLQALLFIVPLDVELADITRNNLIEKLTKLYNGK